MKQSKKIIFISIITFLVVLTSSIVYAVILDNDVQVEKNSELIYYLDVSYDGVDKKGIESSDTTVADIRSDYILVEDKIPEGLTFNGFVETSDGSIGAVKRSDGSYCSGYVVDGINGITYDENTRVVSFKVKNLGAGCKLTVGIKTITPSKVDDPNTEVVETRRDFYNVATATEGTLTAISNTVHVFMGEEEATLYEVKYEYDGTTPDGVPSLPSTTRYAENTSVGVEKDLILEGYRFKGWKTTDVNVIDNKFTMPNKTVVFKGSFEEISSFKVKYVIDSDIPSGYITPLEKEYYPESNVKLDSLKEGDIINGYKFLGWESDIVNITDDNDFIMPERDVVITGKFEQIKYKVTYKFQGANIPENSDNLLPSDKSYVPGEIVKLENYPVLDGYKFLGWYKEDNFEMPEKDIIIYGEWMEEKGVFEPTITKEIIDKKDSYKKGDIVKLKVIVTNNAEYEIHDIYVKENNENTTYIENDNYNVETSNIVKIDKLQPQESIVLYEEYKVTDEEGIIKTENEILGALANNKYNLNTDKEYKAQVDFKVIKKEVKPSTEKNPSTLDNIVKYIILGIVSLVTIISLIVLKKKLSSNN